MIPRAVITAWGTTRAPWPTPNQVEQDLMLSRVILAIADHPLLGVELVFRGGTCLHKLRLDRPWRYSEDLDYVRATDGPIGPVLDALREVGGELDLTARSDVRERPRVQLRGAFEADGTPMRIKIEVNTHERSPALP
ncbi:MAG: nucleotidyl transferase AbiEii/AbiGii toxin family protein, partial [Actinomycetota bacterium]